MVKINYLDSENNRKSEEGDYIISGVKKAHLYKDEVCIKNLDYDKILKIENSKTELFKHNIIKREFLITWVRIEDNTYATRNYVCKNHMITGEIEDFFSMTYSEAERQYNEFCKNCKPINEE